MHSPYVSGRGGFSFTSGEGMPSNVRRANGHRRDMTVAWLRAQHRPCWVCRAFGKSGTIDYSLPARHPLSFECDELVPVSAGGSPYARSNVDAAHRCCNQWRSNKSVEEVLAIAARQRSGKLSSSESVPVVQGVAGVTSSISG